ncbi:hypothetical protein TNCV_2619031 [Trichonephila clavipes]|uniref:Uncharacterized protein n=1 Tax=Trichonephila clavipes TaxID=2585209 RepID=A0A8X7BMB8_TRICX|nr:hypothetical protein TNCV_2619031 [Trichonephila clavipes]
MVSPAVQGQVPHPSIVPEFLRSTSCGMTSARGHGAIVYCLNSGSECCVKGILGTGGVMDKCVQMWTRNYGALGQTARVCFGVLCANRTREVKRDFGDLPIRRDEGRVVNTPLVFKRVLFQERKKRDVKETRESERTKGRKRRPGKEGTDGKSRERTDGRRRDERRRQERRRKEKG